MQLFKSCTLRNFVLKRITNLNIEHGYHWGVILKLYNNPKEDGESHSSHKYACQGVLPEECPATKDSHSWGRLVGGQVVDGTLDICPKRANVAARGPAFLWLGEEKQAGTALSCISCRWLAKGALSRTHSGFPGIWAHRVVGALVGTKGQMAFPKFIS